MISDRLRGRKASEATKQKLRERWAERKRRQELEHPRVPQPPKLPGMTGKKHSEATKQAWSEKRKGQIPHPAVIAKAKASNTGSKRTPEQRARISEGKRAAWQRKKAQKAAQHEAGISVEKQQYRHT